MAQANDYGEYVKTLSPLEKKIFYKVQKKLHARTSEIIIEAVRKLKALYMLCGYEERDAIHDTLKTCWSIRDGSVSVGDYAVPLFALKDHTSKAIDAFMEKVDELSDELG